MQKPQLKLIKPDPSFLTEYLDACRETWGKVHNPYILHDPAEFDQWKKTIFLDYENQANGIGLPAGYVPSVTLWILCDGHYAGTVNLRRKLTPALADYGGHAGLFIRKSMQGKGLAKRVNPLILDEMHKMGVSPVLMTCTDSNRPSFHVLFFSSWYRHECCMADADGAYQLIHRFFYH